MKKTVALKPVLALVPALALATAMSIRADTIATWSFEPGQSSLITASVTSVSTGSIASDVGIGTASGLHSSTATVWSAPAGDANATYPSSVHSLSANNWAIGDYFQFTVNPNLAGFTYSGIQLSWDQTGSNTGPKTWGLWYSTDGSSFTEAGSDYALAFASWNTTTVAANHESVDLSAVTPLNTAPTMYFRIVENSDPTTGSIVGAAIGTAGTDRLDNFTVTATVVAVPEPTSAALLCGFAGLLAWNTFRRKS
jgi:hypothetical protein